MCITQKLLFIVLLISISKLSDSFKFGYNNKWNRNNNKFPYILTPRSTQSSDLSIKNEELFQRALLLKELWSKIVFVNEDTTTSDFRLKDFLLNRGDVKGLIKHFQNCKDCAADNAFLMATQNDNNDDVLRLNYVQFPLLSEDYTQEDDEEDWILKQATEQNYEELRPIFPIENDDKIILADTKAWVRAVIADFGVCPFTMDSERAGIPVGGVRYTISRAKSAEEAFLSFWNEVSFVLSSEERECSTVLLVFPEIDLFGNYELFESYCESLNDALCSSTMCFEEELQLVFFHPKYHFRDGQARTGNEMGAANFARRSPWPIINILRTPQVRAAQKGIPTGQVYFQNEQRLSEIGTETLENMLYSRNWQGLPAHAPKAKALLAKLREHEEEEARLASSNNQISSSTVAEIDYSDYTQSKSALLDSSTINPPPSCPAHIPPPSTPTPTIDIQHPSTSSTTTTGTTPAEVDAGASLEESLAGLASSSGEVTTKDYKKLADDVARWLEFLEEGGGN